MEGAAFWKAVVQMQKSNSFQSEFLGTRSKSYYYKFCLFYLFFLKLLDDVICIMQLDNEVGGLSNTTLLKEF